METHGELFFLWNSLVCIMLIKSILGKIILISVLLRRKKYSRIVTKLMRTRITNTITKKSDLLFHVRNVDFYPNS